MDKNNIYKEIDKNNIYKEIRRCGMSANETTLLSKSQFLKSKQL